MGGFDLSEAWAKDPAAIDRAIEEAEPVTVPGVPEWVSDPWPTIGEDWFTEEPPKRTYLLRSSMDPLAPGMVPDGRVCLLAAPGGAGKSMALVQLALSVATGVEWLGTFGVNRPGQVLLVLAEEETGELRRRLYHAGRLMGLTPDQRRTAAARIVPLPLMGADVQFMSGADPEGGSHELPLVEALRVKLEAGGPWAALIFDPLARFGGPDDEKDNAAATRLIQAFEGFTKAPGNPAVFVAHHTNKTSRQAGGNGDGTSPRGASALVDGARWLGTLERLRVPKSGKPRLVTFQVEKSNYGAYPSILVLAYDSDHGGALRPATDSEWAAWDEEIAAENAEAENRKRGKTSGPRRRVGGGNRAADKRAGDDKPEREVFRA